MTERAPDEGFDVVFGGKRYHLPPLPLGKVYRILPRLMKLRALAAGVIEETDIEQVFDALEIAAEGTEHAAVGFFKTVRGDIVDLLGAARILADQCGLGRLGEAASATGGPAPAPLPVGDTTAPAPSPAKPPAAAS